VTGAGGMLGSDVRRAGERAGFELVALARADLDIADEAAVAARLKHEHANGGLRAIVNCAAWTDVDGAESDPEGARAVNAAGAGILARAAAAEGVPLLHVSTDYVFDGVAPAGPDGSPRAYLESDPTGPCSVYGATKLEGEQQVLAASPRHAVVRTAWLYGVDGTSFAATMLALGAERDSVQVVTDQIGSPTWSGHLAPAMLGLLERGVCGLAHLAGGGHVSWHGFAVEIFRQAEIGCRVEPVTSEQFVRPAPRPAWSALESGREEVIPLPPWQDGLAGYLAARAGMIRR
jgi:dTDP-4-dehydrorhamnose reductase